MIVRAVLLRLLFFVCNILLFVFFCNNRKCFVHLAFAERVQIADSFVFQWCCSFLGYVISFTFRLYYRRLCNKVMLDKEVPVFCKYKWIMDRVNKISSVVCF